MNERKLD